MADSIKYNFTEMRAAADSIRSIAQQYEKAAVDFKAEFTNAITPWEGESRIRIQQFATGAFMEYAEVHVPQRLKVLADLLDANAEQMEKTDRQIADSIPSSLYEG